MIQDIQRLLDEYTAWLRKKTSLREINEWVEITTPYLDRHNDYLQIYARKANGSDVSGRGSGNGSGGNSGGGSGGDPGVGGGGYVLTDDGFTIDDLEQTGCKLETPKRQDLLKMTLNGFGVKLRGNALEVHASEDNFALRKHNLVQAMLAINDMFYLAMPMVASLFYEDVVEWLDLNEIRYTPKVKFTGKSAYDHLFDFVIPKSRRQPERILQAINRPNKDTAQSVAFSWIDTKEVRSPDSRAFALLNDKEQNIYSGVLDALRNYDVRPILWSQRAEVQEELVA